MAPENKIATKNGPQQPDMDAFDTQIKSFKSAIEDLQKQSQEIGKQIAAKSQGKKEYQEKKNDMQVKLKEYSDIIGDLERQRNQLTAADREARDKQRQANRDIQDKQNKIPFSNVKQIDQKIDQIEYRMQTSSMSLQEEKKCVEEIKNLRKIRPEVAKLSREHASATEATETNPNRSKIDAIRAELDEARAAKKKQQEQKDKLIENRKQETSGIDELFKQRDEINKKISQIIEARNQIRDDFNKEKREWAAHVAEQRSQRQAKQQAESLTRQADREKRRVNDLAEQEEINPFVNDIIAYEQAISYCNGLIKKEEIVAEDVKEVQHTNPEGYVVLTKTKVVEPKKGKKLRKGNKENKSSNAGPIKHNLGTIEAFSKLKKTGQPDEALITPPNTVQDVSAVLEQLNTKIEFFRDQVKSWEAEREQRKEDLARTIKEAEAKAEELRRQAAEVLEQAAAKKEAEQKSSETEVVEA